jgi:hypothetical protein
MGTARHRAVPIDGTQRFHLVSRVDRWVVKYVSRWMKTLSSIDVIDSLSLNLSGQSVGDRALHGWVVDMLAEMGPAMCSNSRLVSTR